MKKYGSIGINNEGGQQVPANIHDDETPRINNMVNAGQGKDGDIVGKGIIIDSAAMTDGTPAMSSDSKWYDNFEKYGGNSFVSTEDNSAVGKPGCGRRRHNAHRWIFLAIMVMLIGSYYLHIHNTTKHDDIIQTTHASTDNGFSDSKDAGGGTDEAENNSHSSLPFMDSKDDEAVDLDDDVEAKCRYHLECKSLNLKGNCCPTNNGMFLNCCGP
jgi:hypothetical protein